MNESAFYLELHNEILIYNEEIIVICCGITMRNP